MLVSKNARLPLLSLSNVNCTFGLTAFKGAAGAIGVAGAIGAVSLTGAAILETVGGGQGAASAIGVAGAIGAVSPTGAAVPETVGGEQGATGATGAVVFQTGKQSSVLFDVTECSVLTQAVNRYAWFLRFVFSVRSRSADRLTDEQLAPAERRSALRRLEREAQRRRYQPELDALQQRIHW